MDNKKIFPAKIICIGRNYTEHIEELNSEIPQKMVIFLKPNSSISDELIAFRQEKIHYEGELSFAVKGGKLAAVGFGLDLTKRDLQNELKAGGLPWERAKAFDGSALFSDFISIPRIDEKLSLELQINGKTVQSGCIRQMIDKPDMILAEISTFMSLNDGDIVMTGTPKGVGTIERGDVFEGRVIKDNKIIISVKWIAK